MIMNFTHANDISMNNILKISKLYTNLKNNMSFTFLTLYCSCLTNVYCTNKLRNTK